MADKILPVEPTPASAKPPQGTPAPPVTGAPEAPELGSAKVVRSGAIVMAALWEE